MSSVVEPPPPPHRVPDRGLASATTRAFLLLTALRWLPVGFLMPILVLVPTERGLDLPTVGLVFATYGLTTALLELPTGGLADTIGRKPVLLIATAAETGLLLAWAFGQTAPHFLLGAFVGAVGRALLSGPLESWYVDTIREIDPDVALRAGLARAGTVEGLALACGALLSAVVPSLAVGLPVDGTISQLTLPIYGGVVAEACSFVGLLLLMREPGRFARVRPGSRVRGVATVVRAGLRLAGGTRDLRLIFVTYMIAAVALVSVEVLWQPRFSVLLGDPGRAARTLGYVIVAMSVAAALGADAADRLPGVFARRASATAALGSVLTAGSMLGLAAADAFVPAAVAFVAVYGVAAMKSVAMREMLHERVTGDRRATMLSVESLCQQTGNVVASVVLTRVAAAYGIPTAWAIGAALLVVAAGLLLGVRDEALEAALVD